MGAAVASLMTYHRELGARPRSLWPRTGPSMSLSPVLHHQVFVVLSGTRESVVSSLVVVIVIVDNRRRTPRRDEVVLR